MFDIQNTDFQLSIDLELLGFADIRELCKKPESSLLRLPRLWSIYLPQPFPFSGETSCFNVEKADAC